LKTRENGVYRVGKILMHQTWLLMVTAFIEVGTGLFLLFLPSIPISLLLGVTTPSTEAVLIGRLAGAALLSIGLTCWLGRNDRQLGVLVGVLIYDVAAAALLVYAEVGLGMAGLALWPAVVLHTGLAVWCLACLWVRPRDSIK
jgi:hypothetical protein